MNVSKTIESVCAVIGSDQINAVSAFSDHGWKVSGVTVIIERANSRGRIEVKHVQPSGATLDYLEARQ